MGSAPMSGRTNFTASIGRSLAVFLVESTSRSRLVFWAILWVVVLPTMQRLSPLLSSRRTLVLLLPCIHRRPACSQSPIHWCQSSLGQALPTASFHHRQ